MKAELPLHTRRFAGDRAHPGTAHSGTCSVHSSNTSWAFWYLSTPVPGIRLGWWRLRLRNPISVGTGLLKGSHLCSPWAHLYEELEGRRKSSLPHGASPTHLVLQGGVPEVAKPSLACPVAS